MRVPRFRRQPPRSSVPGIAQGKLVPIDLSGQATGEKRGTIAGNTLELAAGRRVLAGVDFQIGNRMIQLRGQKMPQMPPAVIVIPVHRRAVRLFILHATQHALATNGFHDG